MNNRLINGGRVICASHRGPFDFSLKEDNVLSYRQSVGGLATAIIDVTKYLDMAWVAMAISEGDRLALRELQGKDLSIQLPLHDKNIRLRYVDIAESIYYKYYRVCNELLYFLQVHLYSLSWLDTSFSWLQEAWLNGYSPVNLAVANAIISEMSCEEIPAVVMLHDYHFYLVAENIRKSHPFAIMQQFIHIPWPHVRHWCFLPHNIVYTIFDSLLKNDIIGFQTKHDTYNFLEGVQTLLDDVSVSFEKSVIWRESRRVQVCTYPISISVSAERAAVESLEGKEAAEAIQPFLKKRIIMRADRIDPTKNIVAGFQAYAYLLSEHPELLGEVFFLAFLAPSRQTLSVYGQYEIAVFKMAEEINQTYGLDQWKPIHIFYDCSRTKVIASLQFYDVLLVNSIADGMNLVAKEGSVVNRRDGVLVLSRTAGAFEELGKFSLPLAPTDVVGTAHALYTALTLPYRERRSRLNSIVRMIENNSIKKWLNDQLHDINAVIRDRRMRDDLSDR